MKNIPIKFFLILSLFPVFLHSANNNDLLEKRKIPEAQRAIDGTITPGEFQVNLITNQIRIPEEAIYDLLVGIPAIGIYGAEYLFRKRLALIKLSPEMVMYAMPTELQQQLISVLAPNRSINEALHNKTIYAHIMVNGQTEEKKTGPYNMVFHPFGYAYKQQLIFSESIPMGLFGANGINQVSNGITFNEFKAQNVNPHNGATFALSPNNAQFNISPSRATATFWSAAYSPNKQYVTITYHILANTDTTENALTNIFSQSETLANVLTRMQLLTKSTNINAADRTALIHAMNTIRYIANWQETKHLDDLQQELNQLSRSLQQLDAQLAAISI